MEQRFDLTTIAVAVCVAGYVAVLLGYVTLSDFGLSREVVRNGALMAAALIGAAIGIESADHL
jgi:hypothetical protein